MPEITEKRTVRIPPCKVNKKLIEEIGKFLEGEDLEMSYSLDSRTKTIRSNDVNDFIGADWGSDLKEIVIGSVTRHVWRSSEEGVTEQHESRSVDIRINFSSPKLSEFSVSYENAVWVDGIFRQIESIFEKYKLNYSFLHTARLSGIYRLSLAIITTSTLSYPIYLFSNANPSIEFLSDFLVIFAIFGFIALLSFINWVFPRFEYEDNLQKRVRKWIWIALFGSGIVPSIILKLLGL